MFLFIGVNASINKVWANLVKPEEKLSIENVWYKITRADEILISKYVYNINNLIQKKWSNFRNVVVVRMSSTLSEKKFSLRLTTIFEEIKNRISKIEVLSDIEEAKAKELIEKWKLENTYSLENIDINRVKATWLSWYNWVRTSLWRKPYTYSPILEKVAFEWSKTAKERWSMSHKRNSWDAYYDYNKINSWFKNRWVVCKNIHWATHSENIGYWVFSCKDWECSDELIEWIKTTFNFYMSEKNKASQTHYRSIIDPYFTKIWLWIDVQKMSNWKYKYYLTVDHCTQ